MMRLQKFLAEAGVASRRAAEQLIVAGRISVNGALVRELGTQVEPQHDRIAFDGHPVRVRRKMYVALHKPAGFLTTRRDPLERRTLYDLLPREWAHLHPVGRLDRDSEGLIFLTNDGQFSLRLTHPRYGIRKQYRVTVEGRVEPAWLERLKTGVRDGPDLLRAERVRLVSANNSHSVVEVELAEGKYREVRRLFESQERVVSRLQRVQIGPVKLGELPAGKWRILTEPEIKSLLASI